MTTPLTFRKQISIATVALNQTPLDWDKNLQHHLDALEALEPHDPSIVLFPELSLPGYGCEDWFLSAGVVERSMQSLLQLAPHTKGRVVAVGLPITWHGFRFNAVCILVDGEITAFIPKQHLANDSVYYERRWFRRWEKGVVDTLRVQDRDIPLGDLLLDIDGLRVGVEICEDAWGAERPAATFDGMGVHVILNASMSHFSVGRKEERKALVTESSRTYSCTYAYANSLGLHSGRLLIDGGCYIAHCGTMIAESARFSFTDFQATVATVDVSESSRRHASVASRRVRFDSSHQILRVSGPDLSRNPDTTEPVSVPSTPDNSWERGENLRENELARALSLGLFDYLRKSHQKRVVLSLSGGQDSSTVAAVVRLMVAFGCDGLGVEGFQSRLRLETTTADGPQAEHEVVSRILTCVYQKTSNNSDATQRAALELAAEIGAPCHVWDIEPLVGAYEKMVAESLGLTFSWEHHDIALQNIQARVRSPGIWMLANTLGALLLTTSNRSEASIGYATMDGDTSGGWNPIGGIEKAYISEWLEWLRATGPEGIQKAVTLSSLKLVLAGPPTAELRKGGTQTDETDLMPYPVLDAIERAAISLKFGPVDVVEHVTQQFNGKYTRVDIAGWVCRFFTLWSRNQWKRERFAPALLVDNQNLDPKTACRFPILSGGFAKELEELRALYLNN